MPPPCPSSIPSRALLLQVPGARTHGFNVSANAHGAHGAHALCEGPTCAGRHRPSRGGNAEPNVRFKREAASLFHHNLCFQKLRDLLVSNILFLNARSQFLEIQHNGCLSNWNGLAWLRPGARTCGLHQAFPRDRVTAWERGFVSCCPNHRALQPEEERPCRCFSGENKNPTRTARP